jgi:hypothetical protein
MSRRVSVIITDDLDGSENADTVSFGFRGVAYEVDLGKKNQAKREGTRPFIEATSAARRPAPYRQRSGAISRSQAVRAWARTAGLKVSERGRISADIIRRYEEAHYP